MSIIYIERAFTNSPHLFIETVWQCYTVYSLVRHKNMFVPNKVNNVIFHQKSI